VTLETGFIKPSNSHTPFLLGVAGGSGSGKTYFSEALVRQMKAEFGESVCEVVYQDNFYIDQSHKFDHDGGSVNFDHPDAIDFNLLASCLKKIKTGTVTEIPVYDFSTHKRQTKTLTIQPAKIILVDGILIFHSQVVRELFDDLVFFETPEELRYQRRLERDVKERGRTAEGVFQQFHKQVKPMHDLFVEPSKAFANTIVKDVGHFDLTLNNYCEKLRKL
jgi:uridine kinase